MKNKSNSVDELGLMLAQYNFVLLDLQIFEISLIYQVLELQKINKLFYSQTAIFSGQISNPEQLIFKQLIIIVFFMQLSKPFNFQDNSIFAEHLLRQDPSPQQATSSAQEASQLASNEQTQGYGSINETKFYSQFKKIYSISHYLHKEKIRLYQLHQQLNKKVRLIQDRLANIGEKDTKRAMENSSEENRVKRARRTSELIQKKYKCHVRYCDRMYGSQGSLQQHIKLKHPELYHSPFEDSYKVSESDQNSF